MVDYITSAFKLITTGLFTQIASGLRTLGLKLIGDYYVPVSQTPEVKSHSIVSWQAWNDLPIIHNVKAAIFSILENETI